MNSILSNDQQNFNQFLAILENFEKGDALTIKSIDQTVSLDLKKARSFTFFQRIKRYFYKPKTERVGEVADFTLAFFKFNQAYLEKDLATSLKVVKKAKDILHKNERTRKEFDQLELDLIGKIPNLNKLCKQQELLVDLARQALNETIEENLHVKESILLQARLESEKEARLLIEKSEKENQRALEETNKQLDHIKQEEQETLSRLDRLKTQEKILQKECDQFYDVILVTRDNQMGANSSFFGECDYFKSILPLTQSKFKFDPATPEQKKLYPSVCHQLSTFKDYSESTVQNLIQFILNASIINGLDIASLVDLYRLAQFIQFARLSKACLERMTKDKTNHLDLALYILTSDQLVPMEDRLAQFALKSIAQNFSLITSRKEFLAIQKKYLMEVIKREDLFIKNEEFLFDCVLAWLLARFQDTTHAADKIKEALYEPIEKESLIELMRFEHISLGKISQIKKASYLAPDFIVVASGKPARGVTLTYLETGWIDIEWRLPDAQTKIDCLEEICSEEIEIEHQVFKLAFSKYKSFNKSIGLSVKGDQSINLDIRLQLQEKNLPCRSKKKMNSDSTGYTLFILSLKEWEAMKNHENELVFKFSVFF